MYNINNHYLFVFNLANSIVPWSVLRYLHPFGATQKENIETISVGTENAVYVSGTEGDGFGVRIFCYDQEPLLTEYNRELFSYIQSTQSKLPFHHKKLSIVLLNTELDSDDKDELLTEFEFVDCYYFYHIFAAHDWYRAYYYDKQITNPSTRKLTKKFITLNRLTSNARVYRTLLINELIKHDVINYGHVSFSKECPESPVDGNFATQLLGNSAKYNISDDLITEAIGNINSTTHPLRIDFCDEPFIPNRSFMLDSIPCHMESFVHVVSETNYWGRKKHLTEKIFKPIIMKQPFILVGCAHNLEYLKSYGFKTFDKWWSEEYDNIEDDIERMHAIGDVIATICSKELAELENILSEMQDILQYNFNWFYSRELIDYAWNELEHNLTSALQQAYWTDDYKSLLKQYPPITHLQQLLNDKISADI